jgi:RHS repeat-associated protein
VVVTNLRLPGQYDERLFAAAGITGLQGPYYNWNRWYLPSMGRYLELDPVALRGRFNGRFGPDWYGYALQNATRFVDPLGLWTCQIGVTFTLNIWGAAFQYFGGFAFDGSGNVSWYYPARPGFGVGVGGFVSAGVNVNASDAASVSQLSGVFNNYSAGGGWGPSISADGFWGADPNGQRIIGGGLSYGPGAGAGAFVGQTDTSLYPLYQPRK